MCCVGRAWFGMVGFAWAQREFVVTTNVNAFHSVGVLLLAVLLLMFMCVKPQVLRLRGGFGGAPPWGPSPPAAPPAPPVAPIARTAHPAPAPVPAPVLHWRVRLLFLPSGFIKQEFLLLPLFPCSSRHLQRKNGAILSAADFPAITTTFP